MNCFDNWMHCILLNSLSLPDEMGCHKVLSTKILCVPILGIVHDIVLLSRSGFLNIACNPGEHLLEQVEVHKYI